MTKYDFPGWYLGRKLVHSGGLRGKVYRPRPCKAALGALAHRQVGLGLFQWYEFRRGNYAKAGGKKSPVLTGLLWDLEAEGA
jgi:hypothetical protein